MVMMVPEDKLHEHPMVVHAVGVADFHRKEAQVAVGELAKSYQRNREMSHQLITLNAELESTKKLLEQAVHERDAANTQALVIYEKYERLQDRVLDMAERLTAKE